MPNILIIGAGRSAVALIQYLEGCAREYKWHITVADKSIDRIQKYLARTTRLLRFDLFNENQLALEVSRCDVVISLLPADLHPVVARICVDCNKSLFTASYESDQMRQLGAEVERRGLLFLNEMGLDPGIDHMSAMQIIDGIKAEGHVLKAFESFTGGLVAPDSDDNPWHYKFSWNPRNVVVAGQGETAKFLQEGQYKYIPYNRLFRRTELIDIEGYGQFEGYANRDSLKYIGKYHLQGIPTIYRGTLRRPGFCKAWNVFVQLGATSDNYVMDHLEGMTYRDFINAFLYYHPGDSVETKLYHYLHIDQDSDVIEKLKWLGVFDDQPIGLSSATPAQVLEKLLTEKWMLKPDDKDMVVMYHQLVYQKRDELKDTCLQASMVVEGENSILTAMAKTVGLPLGIAVKLYLLGHLSITGVHIPTIKAVYEPVLAELKQLGIVFRQRWSALP